MSYHVPMHLKQLNSPNEVFGLLDLVHDTRKKDIDDILIAIWHELPSRFHETEDRHDAFRLDKPFMLDALQTRYIYWPEWNLIGLIGFPNVIGKNTLELFPCHVYFQNQSDQDYDYETYDGIPLFRQITRQIRQTKGIMVDNLTDDDPDVDHESIDYDLKSLVYKTISDLLGIEEYVYDDKPKKAHVLTESYLKYAYGITDLQGHYMALYNRFQDSKKGNDEQ